MCRANRGASPAAVTLRDGVPPLVVTMEEFVGVSLSKGGNVSLTKAAPNLTAIAVGFTLVPAVLIAVSLLPLRRYSLDERVPHV